MKVCLYIPGEVSVQAVTSHLSNKGFQITVLPASVETSVGMVRGKNPIAVVVWIDGDPVPVLKRLSAGCPEVPLIVMTQKAETEAKLLQIRQAGALDVFHSGTDQTRSRLVELLGSLSKKGS